MAFPSGIGSQSSLVHQDLALTVSNPPLALPVPPQPASTNPRRLPPPCWTHDETVALIDAYRDKWYSLRRGNLKANHWQEVADAVGQLCPAVSPAKTAVQCRHKMEKLRKRYRTEVQKARSMPVSRFISAWVHFRRMDAMEKGPQANPDVNSESGGDDNDDDDNGDDHIRNNSNYNNQIFYHGNYKNGFANTKSIEKLYRNGVGSSVADVGNFGVGGGCGSGGMGGTGAFRIRIPTGVSIAQPPPPQPPLAKYYAKGDQRYMGSPNVNSNWNTKSNFVGGSVSGSGSGMGSTRVFRANEEMGKKRDREPMEEMVAAIKMLGDGFVRMEQMKMEMSREIERMKMDMEMKRTEMILESQQRIVEVFAKAFSENKKTKTSRISSPES